ncbi:MAG: SRPBCC family protein [Longimicrobiales bacterium]
MVDVVTSIVIDAPRNVVAAYAAEPSRAPEWYENIESVEWRGAPGLREGAKVAFVAHFLGRRLSYTYEIVAHRPGEHLIMRTSDGPFPMQTEYTWSDVAGGSGTKMTLRNHGEPAGFGRIGAPLMTMAMRRANRRDLERLKDVLERATR